MRKTNSTHQYPQYISTSATADLLGFSTATVQKMVDSGIFRHYLTSGKHRRVHREDVIKYCHQVLKKDTEVVQRTFGKMSLVVVSQKSLSDACSQALKELDVDWQCVTNPLDLVELKGQEHHLFWDGMDSWASLVLLAENQTSRHKHVVFNARSFDAEQKQKLLTLAQIFEQDLSPGLIHGYVLGAAAH